MDSVSREPFQGLLRHFQGPWTVISTWCGTEVVSLLLTNKVIINLTLTHFAQEIINF